MAALLKLLTLRKPISGMGKRFYGILSEEMRQTIEKVILLNLRLNKNIQYMK
jgi:hypothetical protein